MTTIYKICSSEEWEAACAAKSFAGAAIDRQDGFIHFSSGPQVKETARLHFKDREGLLLIAVDAENLGPELKWEASRGGDLFPHLFAPLEVKHAKSVTKLPLGDDGLHIFPPLDE